MGAQKFVDKMQDPKYRAEFLKDPIAVLAKEGITLKADDREELVRVIRNVTNEIMKLSPSAEVKFIP